MYKPAMDREHWLAVSPYLDQALELAPEKLEPWLLDLESTAPHIAGDVRRLLAVQGARPFGSFLSGAATPPPLEDVQHLNDGELLGSYRVRRELGRGGMAVVYFAERADGHFEQHVALKVLRVGAQGSDARHHFAQERQILASLNHPAIARLIDGGITPSSLPYLAMEYVEGLRIDRYCDEHRLTIEDRLRLFLKVAEAVQYAHRRLIVHRDIKPSNIVVTADGAVKLLDFGIAKLLEPDRMAHAAPPTLDVVRLMTPEYASPEQARGEAITTATDIYQLGLLLYQLLTGQYPYNVHGRQALEALRVICESEPVRPSMAVDPKGADASLLAAISTARATTPERLHRQLQRDLQAIVLMALRKEPEHRYGSVGRLMEDVDNYLQGRPVSAHKGLWGYRAGKFVRRHAASVVISSIAVCAFAFTIVWYTIQLTSERDRAEREAATASQISDFLIKVFRGSSSRLAQANTPARELLEQGAERIDIELAGQPHVQSRLLNVIGDVYVQYDLQDKAAAVLERALLQNTQLFGEFSKEVADSKFALARLANNSGDWDKSQRLYRETIAIRERVFGPRRTETADALAELGFVLNRLGQPEEAMRTCQRAIDIYTEQVGEGDERRLSVMITLAKSFSDHGELERARDYLEPLIPKIEKSLGPDHRFLARALGTLAGIKVELKEYDGAEQLLRRGLAINERIHGRDHGNVATQLSNLGNFLNDIGRYKDAIEVLERSKETFRRVNGPGHPIEAAVHIYLGRAFEARGEFEAALSSYQLAVNIYRESLGPSHWRYAMALHRYGEAQMDLGNLRAADAALQEALPILQRTRAREHYDIATAMIAHSVVLARLGKAAEAEQQIREAILRYEKALPKNHPLFIEADGALGEALLAQGKVPEAEALLLESARQLENKFSHERRLSLQRLIQLYERKHDRPSSERLRTELASFEREVKSR